MFVGSLARVGEYQGRPWKMDDWLYASRQKVAAAQIIPGVSNTTTAVAAGGTMAAGVGLWALGKFMKWW